MLITTCTHCLARFRISPQQLNARQGQVRCGRCRKVFNGFEALERYPDDDTGSRLLAAREAASMTDPAEVLETLDVEDLTQEAGPAAPIADHEPQIPDPPVAIPPPAASRIERPTESRPARSVPFELPEEPVRVAKGARAWSLGAMLLLLVLGLEGAFAFRAPLAQRYPVLRPWLESVCGYAGCSVAWSRDESLLRLEDSELLEVPGRPNQIALGARIRNLAPVAQDYPYLELTLTDNSGQAAARRVLRPSDYLGRLAAPGEVLAAGSEIAVQLRLETRQLRATGYELLLFYP